MCRLLGYAAPTARTVASVLGSEQVPVFQDMARLHDDGWGSAWLAPDETVHDEHVTPGSGVGAKARSSASRQTRSPLSGLDDDALTRALVDDEASARIVHLRLASQGMACEPENTHPFTADGISFAHNGALKPVALIEELIDPEIASHLSGTTDSERYFAAIRSRVADGAELVDAVHATVGALRERFPIASMNALLLSPALLIAVHASEHALIPHDDFDASGMTDDELPRHHRDEYYVMRYRRLDDRTVVFASSGLDIGGWTPLPAESIAVVDLHTLALTIEPIGRADAGRTGDAGATEADVAAARHDADGAHRGEVRSVIRTPDGSTTRSERDAA